MTFLTLILLAGAMFLLAVTPGPGVLAVIARAMASGFRPAAVVVCGIVLGDLVFLMLAIFGLGALATALGELFTIVKYLGAAYLIWLGIQLWRTKPVAATATPQPPRAGYGHMMTGLVITLGNPKVILFYLGFLPTFVNLQTLSTTDILIIATVVSGVLGATLLGYAVAAAKAGTLIKSEKAQRAMNRAAGGTMIAVGGTLAVKG